MARAEHEHYQDQNSCGECGKAWPCATYKAEYKAAFWESYAKGLEDELKRLILARRPKKK